MDIIVFGAGEFGKLFCQYHDNNVNIVAIADNSNKRIGKRLFEYDIINPDSIKQYKYEKVIITIENLKTAESIVKQLYAVGIHNVEIYDQLPRLCPKIQVLFRISEIISSRNISGSIAECGVYRGWSASYLNEFYPQKKIFLFDTFDGFDERDMVFESSQSKEWFSIRKDEYLIQKSTEYILKKCIYPENIVIKPGYVPESFQGIENETFAFVHLDMDMYKPQLAALRFFSNKMTDGGIILLHDYYRIDLPGTKKAVDDFSLEREFYLIPTANSSHIALILN